MAEMASQTCSRRRKDQRSEKFSSGLVDHTSWWAKSIHVRLEFGRWNTFNVMVAAALYFSQTLHLDALELCGMVFERFVL